MPLRQSIKLQTGSEQRQQVTFDCSKPIFDGRRSERGRQIQVSRNVRQQHDERFQYQHARDSALSAKREINDIELNGEMTRTWRMEKTRFDDGSAPVRNIRDPGQPTESERDEGHEHTSTLQLMVVLCDGTRCEFAAQEIGCSR